MSIKIQLASQTEQQEIADILLSCDSKIAALNHEANLLDELFRTMMEELMTGRLSTTGLIETEATS